MWYYLTIEILNLPKGLKSDTTMYRYNNSKLELSLLVTLQNVENNRTYDYFFIRKYFYTPQTFLKTNLVVSNISTYILRFFLS